MNNAARDYAREAAFAVRVGYRISCDHSRMTISRFLILLALTAAVVPAAPSAAQTVRRIQPATAAIATAVWAGDTLYVSGQLPNPTTPADAAKGTAAVYGDTLAQTDSVPRKIATVLKSRVSRGATS